MLHIHVGLQGNISIHEHNGKTVFNCQNDRFVVVILDLNVFNLLIDW